MRSTQHVHPGAGAADEGSRAKLRARAMVDNRNLVFVLLVATGICFAIAIAIGVARDRIVSSAIAIVVIGTLSAPLLLVPFRVYVRRRDVALLDLWIATRPFPVEGVMETLQQDDVIHRVRATIELSATAPGAETLAKMVAPFDAAAERTAIGVDGLRITLERDVDDDLPDLVPTEEGHRPPNGVAHYLRRVIDGVLVPLHDVHPIDRVRVAPC